MKILFLTLADFNSISERNIYTDLLREFIKHGHSVYIISPTERKNKRATQLIKTGNAVILKLRIGNIQKTNLIEKGISTITLEKTFIKAIKQYFSSVCFDLVLYSTPPITFQKSVGYIKKRDGAKTYLLLKDIFPQNAVDMGMLSKKGIKAPLYHYFRNKEKKLYAISDYIGCMSQANVDFILKHNPMINPAIVEVCPNSIDVLTVPFNSKEHDEIRRKYGIPLDKKVFVYGGNLGRPQGIPYVLRCLETQINNLEIYILIIGDGTEFFKIQNYLKKTHPKNMKLLRHLPKEDYDKLVAVCDVGMIFLDHRFSIPNFPSRILSYMEAKLPVLACTDKNTDIGKIIVEGGFGLWCESDNEKDFHDLVKKICNCDLKLMGNAGFKYLRENYSVSLTYETIIKHVNGTKNKRV